MIGVDLGGTNIAVGVVEETYRIRCTVSAPTRAEAGPEALLDDVAACVRAAMEKGGCEEKDCVGVGLGAPGSCDRPAGVVRYAPNLDWHGVPAAKLLSERLGGLRVALGNDADCAALAETVAGAACGSESVLLITLGTGVGGGLILGGRVYSGFRGRGGEFGHMVVDMGGAPCGCGQEGCWEAYASATALVRQARQAARAHPESMLNALEPLDGRRVYEAAAAGDAAAQAVTAQYAEYVGVGLVGLINTVAPETVLLGGGVSGAGEALLAPVRGYVRAHAFFRDPELLPDIRAAALGNDAGIIGAAALVWA